MNLTIGAIAIGLLVAGGVLTHAAVAQPGPGRGGFTLPGVDADGDGLITRSEANAAIDARFEQFDTNADGAISRDEIRTGFEARRTERRERMQSRADERFGEVDANGDGALSLAEMQAARPELTQERFALMDRNDDGLITSDELPVRGRPGGPGPFGQRGQ